MSLHVSITSRNLFKKTRDTKRTFHTKMGTIKHRNGVWTLEKRKILRRGNMNIQKDNTKKDLNDSYNHDHVITHLEPDILNVKASGPQEA